MEIQEFLFIPQFVYHLPLPPPKRPSPHFSHLLPFSSAPDYMLKEARSSNGSKIVGLFSSFIFNICMKKPFGKMPFPSFLILLSRNASSSVHYAGFCFNSPGISYWVWRTASSCLHLWQIEETWIWQMVQLGNWGISPGTGGGKNHTKESCNLKNGIWVREIA